MGPLSGSLVVRLSGVLLLTVVLFNVVMAVALYAPIGDERANIYRMPPPDQAAAIVGLLDDADAAGRAKVLLAINSNGLSVTIVQGYAAPAAAPSSLLTPVVSHYLTDYAAVFPDRDIHVELNRPGFFTRLIRPSERQWEPSRLYVGLTSGGYVLFEPTRGAVFDTFLSRGLLLVGIAGIIVLVGIVFAVRQTARPITRLAAQARTLGETLDAPDITVTGPKEVRALAGAFNQMKGRIASLIAQRTQLLAAVAHDMRTYLTRLRLRADFIADDDQRNRASGDIDEMEALVNDTLTFASADNGPADPNAAVDLGVEIARFLEARREVGGPVSFEGASPAGVRVSIDALSLRRILANLCDNAIRYGERARLSVESRASDCAIHIDDDGPGVPEADLARIAVPFERLEPSRARTSGGAGLGLAIVSALAKAYGGAFSVANRTPGLRATVTLKRATT